MQPDQINRIGSKIKKVVMLLLAFLLVIVLGAIFLIFKLTSIVKVRISRMILAQKIRNKNKFVLFVYSDSMKGIWREYLEESFLKDKFNNFIIIKLLERGKWDSKKTLEYKILNNFIQGSNHFPIAITFFPGHKPRIFKFNKPLKEFKRGNTQEFLMMKNQLINALKGYLEAG